MEFISNEKVEEIAAELFKYYKETLNVNQDVLYIEPLVLAEMLGYEVILLEFGEDSDVLGLTVFRDMDVTLVDMYGKDHRLHLTNKSIVVNKSLREVCFGRYKFTIAHELAHHIIDERFNAEYLVKYRKLPHFVMDSPQVLPVSYDEVIANRLAAAILIPIDILKNSFKNVFGETYIESVNGGLEREKYQMLKSMAKLFGVSTESLIIRLKTTGMLGKYKYETLGDMLDKEYESKIA